MLNNIAPDLFTVSDFLTPAECEQLITRGEGIGFEPATVGLASGPKMMANIRNNDRVTFEDPDLANWLWKRAALFVPPTWDDSHAAGLNERIRFYRYDPAQRFTAHRDGAVERSPTERSRMTLMVYLNECAEGGETVFYSEERVDGLRKVVARIQPTMGTALFFAHEWWHEGAKVVRGRKYVLRTDVMYKSEASE